MLSSVGIDWAVTKHQVGVGWAVTKYQVGVGLGRLSFLIRSSSFFVKN